MKISIVIPAHNEENYIKQTLHSIKLQTYQNYEIIVVSNGSTDKTDEIVRKRENEKLKLYSIPEANVSIARNHGATKAIGEVLLFLDADTLLTKNTLLTIKNNFTKKYSVGTTLSKPDLRKFKYHFATGFKNFYHLTKLAESSSGALICNREKFFKVGGYPPIIVREHRALIKKLRKYGKFICLRTDVITSMRRLKNWGLMKSIGFWIKQGLKDSKNGVKKSKYEKIR